MKSRISRGVQRINVTAPRVMLMDLLWPDGLGAFEIFLKSRGLICQYRQIVMPCREKLMQYEDESIGIRMLSEKGKWFTEVADLGGKPGEWYDAKIIGNLIGDPNSEGPVDKALPIDAQLTIIEDN